jgi:tetratricopeptide (TPR) repeat protein
MAFKEPQIGTVADLANRMRLSRPEDGLAPITFLIGAGCSVSAGIPAAKTIAKSEVQKLAKRFGGIDQMDDAAALAYIGAKGTLKGHKEIAEKTPDAVDWGAVYDAIFAEVWTAPDEVSAVFKSIIKQANPRINWAHLALGELARQRWIATTITTNFDLFALEGYARAGVIPIVSDGIESLGRIASQPEHPQLLQINGSVHAYRLRNSPDDLDKLKNDPAAITFFNTIYQHSNLLVIVGYEGREPQIMTLLIEAATRFPDKHIFWCLHSSQPKDLSEKATEFLSHSANARLLIGQDADKFFFDLCHELGVGAPMVFRDPLGFIGERLDGIFDATGPAHSDINKQVEGLKARLNRLKTCEATQPPIEQPAVTLPERPDNAVDPTAMAKAIEDRLAKEFWDNPEGLYEALRDEQDRWFVSGRDKGLAFDLDLSIALAEASLARAQTPDQRGIALNILGISLQTLGDRQSDPALLQRAVTAFEQALLERTRNRVPLDWAMTQNNLGNALSILGDRQSDIALMQRAVTVYEQALLERTRDRVPLDWAMTQNNLGNALKSLGALQSDPALMQRAITAYEQALLENTRDRVPLDWAMTQNNFGNALISLGARQSNPALLQRALTAYEQALMEYTRDRVPMDWAGTQANLASLDLAFHRLAPDPAPLAAAKEKALAARQVFQDAGATAYLEMVGRILSDIDTAQGPQP